MNVNLHAGSSASYKAGFLSGDSPKTQNHYLRHGESSNLSSAEHRAVMRQFARPSNNRHQAPTNTKVQFVGFDLAVMIHKTVRLREGIAIRSPLKASDIVIRRSPNWRHP